VKPFLLDVNLLLALAWDTAESHGAALAWFAKNKSRGFATCPITQSGFVRLSSNATVFPKPASPWSAVIALESLLSDQKHHFWPDDIPMRQAMVRVGTLHGHRQVTDAYLIGLAEAHAGKLATLDRKILQLAPDVVEMIV